MASEVPKPRVKKVPLSEIKDDLSRFLRDAETREIVITRHGKPAGHRGLQVRALVGEPDSTGAFRARTQRQQMRHQFSVESLGLVSPSGMGKRLAFRRRRISCNVVACDATDWERTRRATSRCTWYGFPNTGRRCWWGRSRFGCATSSVRLRWSTS